ncbi:hypothetical protein NCCP2331_23150 [Sporosarcina sp. NCCP-2331]|nr:hypothetical protein NCCP2331_23150 [Sporosarcina sp. NCCP-2331]GLB56230.1 hypothetical protein NCCP2378_20170 [Sporosarcina sp. NCCP-2378]
MPYAMSLLGKDRASCLTATADPAVAPSLVLEKVQCTDFFTEYELAYLVLYLEFANASITRI